MLNAYLCICILYTCECVRPTRLDEWVFGSKQILDPDSLCTNRSLTMSPMRFLSLAFSAACSTAVAEECNAMLQTDLRSASGMMSRLDFKHAVENRGSKAIPCVIHQTSKTHTLKEQEAKWAQTWKDKNPKCQYKLWNDTEIAELAQKASPKVGRVATRSARRCLPLPRPVGPGWLLCRCGCCM